MRFCIVLSPGLDPPVLEIAFDPNRSHRVHRADVFTGTAARAVCRERPQSERAGRRYRDRADRALLAVEIRKLGFRQTRLKYPFLLKNCLIVSHGNRLGLRPLSSGQGLRRSGNELIGMFINHPELTE